MKRFAILGLMLAASTFAVASSSIVTSSPAFAQAAGGGRGGGGPGDGGSGNNDGVLTFFQQQAPAGCLAAPCTPPRRSRLAPMMADGCGGDAHPARIRGRMFCDSRHH
jgi:hypothetical protein